MIRRGVMLFGAVLCIALSATGCTGCDPGAGPRPYDPTKKTSQAKSVGEPAPIHDTNTPNSQR
jgi:hypothetical protein